MSVTTWFVTGASRGFGRELTGQLLAAGHRVAATLRRPEQLDDLAGRHQDRLWVRALDVTDTGQMRRVVAEAFADLGRVDVVVSNAGFGVFGAAEDLTDAQVEAMIATNLTASIQLARAVVPLRNPPNRRRTIASGRVPGFNDRRADRAARRASVIAVLALPRSPRPRRVASPRARRCTRSSEARRSGRGRRRRRRS